MFLSVHEKQKHRVVVVMASVEMFHVKPSSEEEKTDTLAEQ